MSVEDWARREAEKRYPTRLPYNARFELMLAAQGGFQDGAGRAFDALLSDEAVAAAARISAPNDWDSGEMSTDEREWLKTEARAALEAAVRAVTDPKTHDSSTTTTGEHTNG